MTRTLSISIYDQVQDFAYAQANHTSLLLLSLSFLALLIIYGRRGQMSDPRIKPGYRSRLSESIIGKISASAPAAVAGEYLQVAIEHTLGDLSLRVSCALSAPWTVLFGPSGAGKTSLLRVLGGLIKPDRGRVVLHGRTLVETERERGCLPRTRHRLCHPAAHAVPPHECNRQCCLWLFPASAGARARSAWRRCLISFTPATSPSGCLPTFPEARSSAWRWLAPSLPSRACCCWTSLSLASMRI